jgi:uncharacterized protein (DUF433 family)
MRGRLGLGMSEHHQHEIVRDEFTLRLDRQPDGNALVYVEPHSRNTASHIAVRVFYWARVETPGSAQARMALLSRQGYEQLRHIPPGVALVINFFYPLPFDQIAMVTIDLLNLEQKYDRVRIGIDWAGCPEVQRDPEVMSGAWCVRGTRVTVDAILENNPDCSLEDLAYMFELDPGIIQRVLDYAGQ